MDLNGGQERRLNFKFSLNKIIIAGGLVAIILISFLTGIIFQKKNIYAYKIKGEIELISEKIGRYFLYGVKPLDTIYIDIKHKDYQKLAYQREVAIKKMQLEKGDDDFVPVKMHFRNKKIKAKVRLKGDLIDHFRTKKWSYRVKIKSNDTIYGMKIFSLQNPASRGHAREWFFHQMLKREGLIALRYKFVNVNINGKDLGIHALEEHFGKRLLENNQLLEAPIMKYDETAKWKEFQFSTKNKIDPKSGLGKFQATLVKAFAMGGIGKSPTLKKNFLRAKDLLIGFRQNKIPAKKAFDLKKMARFAALAQIFGGGEHILDYRNIRFYYNPITALLEPIGYDSASGIVNHDVTGLYNFEKKEINGGEFINKFLQSDKFLEMYISNLDRFSQKSYLDQAFSELGPQLDQVYKHLRYTHPISHDSKSLFDKDIYYLNQRIVRNLLDTDFKLYSHIEEENTGHIKVAVRLIHKMPVKAIYLVKNGQYYRPLENKNLFFDPQEKYQMITFEKGDWPAGIKKKFKKKGVQLYYKHPGKKKVFKSEPMSWGSFQESNLKNHFIFKDQRPTKFSFIKEKNGVFTISAGSWDLSSDLIVPAERKLVISPGVKLTLKKGVKIISFSPVEMRGERNRRIVFRGQSGAQGIAVINAGQRSIVNNVDFKNLSAPDDERWSLSGAVTFYKSDVDIRDVSIDGVFCEDALNIKNSKFTIENLAINKTKSDAVDSDFSNGHIRNLKLSNVGNDGIDTSGTELELDGIFMTNSGDKGLSFGERSLVRGKNIKIQSGDIGVAVKDSSVVNLSEVELLDIKVGFSAFRKKPEYEQAKVSLNKIKLTHVEKPFLIEEGSVVTLDGHQIDATGQKVKDVFYGNIYGKKTEKPTQ